MTSASAAIFRMRAMLLRSVAAADVLQEKKKSERSRREAGVERGEERRGTRRRNLKARGGGGWRQRCEKLARGAPSDKPQRPPVRRSSLPRRQVPHDRKTPRRVATVATGSCRRVDRTRVEPCGRAVALALAAHQAAHRADGLGADTAEKSAQRCSLSADDLESTAFRKETPALSSPRLRTR